MPTEAETPARKRDVRVDPIGVINVLVTEFQEPLIDAVKVKLDKGDRVEGDFFEGLVSIGVQTKVDADGLVKLWEAGKVTRAQFVRMISVKTAEAKKILAEADLLRISTTELGSKSLRVTRKDGVDAGIIEAVNRLSAVLEKKATP
jgi:hypothetical protein